MKADIVTIGDEILIGQILDTNSAFLGSELSALGFEIRRIISISDSESDITDTLDESIQSSDLVVLTGGLGPTNDDKTKVTLNRYFEGELVIHEPTLKQIERFFAARNLSITERNKEQAYVPSTCFALLNGEGTAPGMVFRRGEKLIVSLPGVPFEMRGLFSNQLSPYLQKNYDLPFRSHTTILTCGLSESATADKIKDWEDALSDNVTLAYLPSPGLLRLRLSASGVDGKVLNYNLKKKVQQLAALLGKEAVFGYNSDTLQGVIGKLLSENNLTLGVAESCTGGNVAKLLTSVPGSSKYFKGSVTAYSNDIKVDFLGVDKNKILEYGAVSQQIIEQMVVGVKGKMATDFAVASSGIAGPTGGTPEKPIGTIWIAVATPDKMILRHFLFGDNRERNVVRATNSALNILRLAILEYLEK